MEQRNNNQNSVIFQIEELLNKMSNQIRFLIRNDEALTQLDLDLLMKNTRKLYDTLCSVDADADFDSDSDTDSLTHRLIDSLSPEDNSDSDFDADSDDDTDDDFDDDSLTHRLIDSLSPEDNSDFDTDDDTDDDFDDDSLTPEENDEEDSGIRVYRRVNNELQTLGDKLEKTEDISLAARLQRKPVTDLMSAIGINDKFLFLNELFNGSMEKYNKSIRALNNFSTLLGAKTYMSELQIEFQWNCESDAYIKLNDLIERRFI